MADAVHSGILDAGHGVCAYWYGKHKAYSLFGTPPSFGWDAHGFLGWFYAGGGEALYKELVNDILKLNLVGFLYFPMPTQPLGWFKKEIKSGDDFKGMKYRTVGLSADVFKEMGAAVTILPGGEIVPAMDRGLLDCGRVQQSVVRHPARLPGRLQVLHDGQPPSADGGLRGHLQQGQVRRAVARAQGDPAQRGACGVEPISSIRPTTVIRRTSRRSGSAASTSSRPTTRCSNDQLAAWDKVIAAQSQEPFFKKVIDSQKAWVKRTSGYLQVNNLDSNALGTAYKHFFG